MCQYGLLTKEERQNFFIRIKELALETPDAGFLSSSLRNVLTPNEINEILELVRTELLPNLSDTIYQWKDNFHYPEEPGEYFSPLIDTLDSFKKNFSEDANAVEQIDLAINSIENTISELISEGEERAGYGEDILELFKHHKDQEIRSEAELNSNRSIFTDVDE